MAGESKGSTSARGSAPFEKGWREGNQKTVAEPLSHEVKSTKSTTFLGGRARYAKPAEPAHWTEKRLCLIALSRRRERALLHCGGHMNSPAVAA